MIKTHKVYYPLYEDKEHSIFLVTGGRACERPEQEVMMADLSVKQIKDIVIGDKVMGDDGTPRMVLSTHRGHGRMYEVSQSNGETYYVNDEHILSLRKSYSAKNDMQLNAHGMRKFPNGRYPSWPDELDMPIEDFLRQPKRWQYHFRGYKVESIPYPYQDVLIEPYLLGLWLGDGTAAFPQITTPDKEIENYLCDYAKRHNLSLTELRKNKGSKAKTFNIRGDGKAGGNEFLTHLKEYNLIDNKHIPQCYISNSEDVRLQLLAGLLDTDGSYDGYGYEFSQKNEKIAKDVRLIAASLGFRSLITKKKAKIGNKDYGIHYRVSISGDVWRIPCKVAHKVAKKGDSYNYRTFSQSSLRIKPAGEGDWCGIRIDGNHRYVHSDGTVTHNSGKSYGVGTFIERLTFEYNKAKQIAHQILFTRYTMTSASISIIPEFLEKVELDGTEQYFHKSMNDVVNTMTKSRVMFRGIHTSSGNQTAKLKSIQGITTFVLDEGEEWLDEEGFEKILFSIRTKGLRNRVIIIMNPSNSTHWVYEKYIKNSFKWVEYDGVPVQISTDPRVCHIHTSYLDNLENLSEEFLKEILAMKRDDPEKYAHVIMGRWSDVAEGAVFKKWGIVDEFPAHAKKVARAMDFGYSCFKGDTLIMTKRGEIPIKDIRIGDFVLTRKGYRRVRNKMYNGVKDVITKEITIDGIKHKLSATYEHNINVNGKWKKYGELTEKDKLYVLSHSTGSSTRDTQTANTQTTTITNGKVAGSISWNSCIMRFMNTIMAKYPMGMLYTTKIATRLITISATLLRLLRVSTVKSTTALPSMLHPSKQEKCVSQKRIGGSVERRLTQSLQQRKESVNIAERSLFQPIPTNDSVHTNAIINGNTRQKNVISRWCVNVAESLSWVINTLNRRVAAKSVLISSHGIEAITTLGEEKCDVFDLEIEGVHEYFANGILVHNCDPTAICRCGIVGNRLYIDELCYRTGMTSGDIIRELRQEEERGDGGFVYCESADPRLIDEITLGGHILYPVSKGPGSILAGLAKMLDMEIFVTKRSLNLQEELRNYIYAKDRFGKYTSMPEDHHNHIVDSARYFVLGCLEGKVMHPRRATKADLGVY